MLNLSHGIDVRGAVKKASKFFQEMGLNHDQGHTEIPLLMRYRQQERHDEMPGMWQSESTREQVL
ncbi:MAG: hypothetical protein M1511_03820 [Deltaproteobacteria bacterium]|nr:hypothetical protein [Deltaproteobacteria bacterium]